VEIYDSTFESNYAYYVSNFKAVPKLFREFSLTFLPQFPAGHTEQFRMTTAPSILLKLSQTRAQDVSLVVSFHLYHFLSPPERLLPKNYLKISLPFPARDMKLLGRSY
jgi:hypothetical protein